jgi:hypothetical protein
MVRAMGMFSPPSISYAPPMMPALPPPPPTPVDKTVEEAAARTRSQLAAAGGFGSTLLTSGQGVTTPAPVTAKTLLGL